GAARGLRHLLRADKRLLAVLALGDVREDSDRRAVGRLAVADLHPAAVAQAQLECRPRLPALCEPGRKEPLALALRQLDEAAIHVAAQEVREGRALNDLRVRKELAKLLVAEDEPVLGIKEREGLGDALDRLDELTPGARGAFARLGLGGDVPRASAETGKGPVLLREDRERGNLEQALGAVL